MSKKDQKENIKLKEIYVEKEKIHIPLPSPIDVPPAEPSDEDKEICVNVKTKSVNINVYVSPDDTIGAIKSKIEDKAGILPEFMKLKSAAGVLLDNDDDELNSIGNEIINRTVNMEMDN